MTQTLLTKPFPRLWQIDQGTIMVVADIHGDWEAYQRYRDEFLRRKKENTADVLIFLGDLIHAEGTLVKDRSLEIVLDLRRLQQEMGTAVLVLCGNHELPHMYSFGLSKGKWEYTPAFEARLTETGQRAAVLDFFYSLPLYIRTAAGVSLAHAGASIEIDTAKKAQTLFNWDHAQKLTRAENILKSSDIPGLQRSYAKLSGAQDYGSLARHYMGATGPNDPRYNVLLRGAFVTMDPEYDWLYTALFTKCEKEYGIRPYGRALTHFLNFLSEGYSSQRFLVAGHINIPEGHQTIVNKHLRITSNYHAKRKNGVYLLLDSAKPITHMAELAKNLHRIW